MHTYFSSILVSRGPAIISCVLLLAVALLQAANASSIVNTPDWKLKREKNGVQVYVSKVNGSRHKAVRAITVIDNARLSPMVALILDAEACPEWAYKCTESYVHEKISETEFLIYSNSDMPSPIKDRDVLAQTQWRQHHETFTVTMTSTATQDIIPKIKGRVRLTEAKISWTFEPADDGSVRVINEAHVNPGSSMPGWLTNRLLINMPYRTLLAFKQAIQQEQYQSASISFIEEYR